MDKLSYNPLSIKLCTLNTQHAKQIFAIEQACFSMPWSLMQCESAFRQEHYFALGLLKEQELLAYMSFYKILDELEILNIAVLPKFRRQGLGKYLLINTLQAAAKMGMTNAVLEVRINNIAARTLYEGAGFECVGTRVKYYTDTGEDALIYRLVISS